MHKAESNWDSLTAAEQAEVESQIAQKLQKGESWYVRLHAADPVDLRERTAKSYKEEQWMAANWQAFQNNKEQHGVTNVQVWDFAADTIIDYWAGFLTKTTPPLLTALNDLVEIAPMQDAHMVRNGLMKNEIAEALPAITDAQEHIFRRQFRLYLEGLIPSATMSPTRLTDKDWLMIHTMSDYGLAGMGAEAMRDAGLRENYKWVFPMKAYAGLTRSDGLMLSPHGTSRLYIPLSDLPKTIHDLGQIGRPNRPKPSAGNLKPSAR